MRRACLLVLCVWVGPLAIAEEATEEARTGEFFLRFVDEGPFKGRLETSIRRYRDGNGREVALIGVVHVGDRRYYERLNREFEKYDVVLYEGVLGKEDLPWWSRVLQWLEANAAQVLHERALALTDQGAVIDYEAKNLVHADLDGETYGRLARARNENSLSMLFRYRQVLCDYLAEWRTATCPRFGAGREERRRALKWLVARELARIFRLYVLRLDDAETVIIHDRNKVVLGELQKQLGKGKKRLAIFYGAAHMPDFEQRIGVLGFRVRSSEWRVAWDLGH